MLDMFSLKDMLNFFVEGEGKDEPSPREQKISKGIEEEKNFRNLKFSGGLSGNIIYAVYSNQSQFIMPSTLDHKMTKLWPQSQVRYNLQATQVITNLYTTNIISSQQECL